MGRRSSLLSKLAQTDSNIWATGMYIDNIPTAVLSSDFMRQFCVIINASLLQMHAELEESTSDQNITQNK